MTIGHSNDYPVLSQNGAHKIVALSDTEVGKIIFNESFSFLKESQPFQKDIKKQGELLVFANRINKLLPQFIRFEDIYNNFHGADRLETMIVMERLYPLEFEKAAQEQKETYINEFERKILQLHAHGFVHGDIVHPMGDTIEILNNIVLTDKGLRLVDVGFSELLSTKGTKAFKKMCKQELEEIKMVKEYLMNSCSAQSFSRVLEHQRLKTMQNLFKFKIVSVTDSQGNKMEIPSMNLNTH